MTTSVRKRFRAVIALIVSLLIMVAMLPSGVLGGIEANAYSMYSIYFDIGYSGTINGWGTSNDVWVYVWWNGGNSGICKMHRDGNIFSYSGSNTPQGIIFLNQEYWPDNNDTNNGTWHRTVAITSNLANNNGKCYYINGYVQNGSSENYKTNQKTVGIRNDYNIPSPSTQNNGDASLDIPTTATRPAKDPNKYYVSTNFYDYYSDYELSGRNRKTLSHSYDTNYDNSNGYGWTNYRYIPTISFDTALSDYYSSNSVTSPLYFGHFQWKWNEDGTYFSNWNSTLNLAGTSNMDTFFYNNNSEYRSGCSNCKIGKNPHTHETDVAIQGLYSNTLSGGATGVLTLPSSSGAGVTAPFFNESYLRGRNSKGRKYGFVFHDVDFPFADEDGYWTYDSSDADQTLRMKKATDTNSYYLDEVGSSGVVYGYTEGNIIDVPNFFPFNDHTNVSFNKTVSVYDLKDRTNHKKKNVNAKSDKTYVDKLNYGFGMEMAIPFKLNSAIKDSKNRDITFKFAGDDDMVVYFDGTLVLDIGGSHGAVGGEINFTTGKVSITSIKNSTGQTDSVVTTPSVLSGIDTTKQHTLKIYYMERGIWESNLYVRFNLPVIEDTLLEVEKSVVLPSGMNSSVKTDIQSKLANLTFPVSTTTLNMKHYSIGSTEATTATVTGNSFRLTNNDSANSKMAFFKNQLENGDTVIISEPASGKVIYNGKQSSLNLSNLFNAKWELFKAGASAATTSSTSYGVGGFTAVRDGVDKTSFEFGGTVKKPDRVKFTNTFKLGSMKIKKKIQKNGATETADSAKVFTFRITFTDYLGIDGFGLSTTNANVTILEGQTEGEVLVTGIPIGTTFSVEEIDKSGYDTVDWEGGISSGQIPASGAVLEVTAVNDRTETPPDPDETTIKIVKKWVDSNADHRGDVKFRLERSIDEGEWELIKDNITLTKATQTGNEWVYTLAEKLPIKDYSDNTYYYRVLEYTEDGKSIILVGGGMYNMYYEADYSENKAAAAVNTTLTVKNEYKSLVMPKTGGNGFVDSIAVVGVFIIIVAGASMIIYKRITRSAAYNQAKGRYIKK